METQIMNNQYQTKRLHPFKRLRGLALIGAPLLFLLSEIVHPESQTETIKELANVSEHMTQWFAAHLLVLGAIIMLPFAVQGLLDLLDGRFYTLGHIAAGLTSTGIIGVTGLLAFDLITWQMVANGPNEEMVRLYDRIAQSPGFSLPFLTIGPLMLVLGLLLFSIALFRSRAVSRWQSVFLGAGIFLYGFAGPVFPVSNGILLVISGAVMMLISLSVAGFKTVTAGKQ